MLLSLELYTKYQSKDFQVINSSETLPYAYLSWGSLLNNLLQQNKVIIQKSAFNNLDNGKQKYV